MNRQVFSLIFLLVVLWGVAMPVFANPVHPADSEGKPFKERSIVFYGAGRQAVLILAYPDPDEIVDRIDSAGVDVYGKYQTPLGMNFNYPVHFWQGIFGRVGFDINIKGNKSGSPSWDGLPDLLQTLRSHQITRNELTKRESSESRQEWLMPEISELNGYPCVKQSVRVGNNPDGELHYYFLFDRDRAIEIKLSLVDNSTRPGLAVSDWRPRAEEFMTKLLSSVKFNMNVERTTN
jgi:hypothetical protein